MSKYIVEVQDLGHAYQTHEKGAGLLNTIKDLFSRSVTHVEALKKISFHIFRQARLSVY